MKGERRREKKRKEGKEGMKWINTIDIICKQEYWKQYNILIFITLQRRVGIVI